MMEVMQHQDSQPVADVTWVKFSSSGRTSQSLPLPWMCLKVL